MLLSRSWLEAAVTVLTFSGSTLAACSQSQADMRSRVRCFGGNGSPWPQDVWNAAWTARVNVCEMTGSGLHASRPDHAYAEIFYDSNDYNDARACCYDALESIIFSCMDTNAGKWSTGGQLCLYNDGQCKDQYQVEMIR
ncbi:hypothetical protein BGZ63DRAFT_402913 [Mariannaea sp. PMI_226]|nr:hypothetical protein BGZ63DRAFT_402913 [Mariannaea sp. PMI_226]